MLISGTYSLRSVAQWVMISARQTADILRTCQCVDTGPECRYDGVRSIAFIRGNIAAPCKGGRGGRNVRKGGKEERP